MDKKEAILAKINALNNLLQEDGLDGMIITDCTDRYYLLCEHIAPKEAVLLVYKKGLVCVTRKLFLDSLNRDYPYVQFVGQDHEQEQRVLEVIASLGLKKVGFDAGKEEYAVGKLFKAAGCVEAKSYLSQLREVKDEREIELMRESGRIAYNAYEHIKSFFREGVTELEVVAELERYMRVNGASGTAFDTIVGFGEETGDVHSMPGNRKLKWNEAVTLDFGCIYNGYCSDMTRSWWFGDKEPEEYKKIWALVNEAWQAGLAAEKPGMTGQEMDSLARKIITDGGYGEYFTHRLGHGIGMVVHEEPCNDQNNTKPLQKGNVVTVEPGIYLPGKFGVRLEETTVVTDTGAEILTRK